MLLSEWARSFVSRTMTIGCFLKIYPYKWDKKNYCLIPASYIHIIIFRIHEIFIFWTAGFMSFRFLQTINDDIPSRIRVMNLIWILAYGLVLVVNSEFEFKREEVMYFINSLFDNMENTRRRESLNLKKKDDQGKKIDWTSWLLLISSILLYVNPPAHATVLFSSPCAPQYLTSLIFPCKFPADIPVTFLEILPFVLLENIFITDMMFCGLFGWTFVFLGLTWIKEKMMIITKWNQNENKHYKKMNNFDKATENYRQGQLLTVLLNDAFKPYLQWFPSILFAILGMLIFGTIRYHMIDLHSYSVFPLCSLRCVFDAVSLLSVAGDVNQRSGKYLIEWRKHISNIPNKYEKKYLSTFHKSCWRLSCSSGGLYTLENSIVLVSLNNCTQLVFNMLVTY